MGKKQKATGSVTGAVENGIPISKADDGKITKRSVTKAELEAFIKEKSVQNPKVATMFGSKTPFVEDTPVMPRVLDYDGVVFFESLSKAIILERGKRWAIFVFGTREDAFEVLQKAGMTADVVAIGASPNQ